MPIIAYIYQFVRGQSLDYSDVIDYLKEIIYLYTLYLYTSYNCSSKVKENEQFNYICILSCMFQ